MILNLQKIAEVRGFKLSMHSFFIMFLISILFLFGADLVGWTIGRPIEKDMSYIPITIFIVWFFFALKSDRYKKTARTDEKNL